MLFSPGLYSVFVGITEHTLHLNSHLEVLTWMLLLHVQQVAIDCLHDKILTNNYCTRDHGPQAFQ